MPPEASHQQLGAGGSGGLRPPRTDGCGRLCKPSGVATNADAFWVFAMVQRVGQA